MNKLIAIFVASLMLLPVVASISPTITGIVPLWDKEWESEPDDNWVSDKVRIPDENDYQFGMTDIGVDYSRHMAISDNGMYAAINFAQSGPGITINEYEVTAGETFQAESHIKDAAISDDGRYFAQANDGGATRTLRFFDTSEPEPLWSYDYSGEVNGVDISSDGEWTAICLRQNYTGHLISREFETIKTISFGAGKSCKSVDISDDSSKVAFAWTDDATVGEFGVYDMDLNQIWTNTSVQYTKLHIKLNHDGSRLFIGTKSDAGSEPEAMLYDATGTLLWGVDSDKDSQFVRYSQGQTLGPTFSDVDYFLNSDNSQFLHMYNGGSSTPIWSEGPFTGQVWEGEFSDNASVLAVVAANGGLYVYNNPGLCSVTCESDAAIQLPGAPTSAEISVDVSPDGTTIIASGGSGGGHEYVMIFTDGGNGWDQSDMDPIWAKEDDSEDVLVANGIFAYTSAGDETIRYGRVPIYTQSYDHDTPIDTVWDGSDYTADYKALGDLIGLWMMDDGSGTTPADSSGNGNDGAHASALEKWTSGQIGGGLKLEQDVGDYITVSADSTLDVDNSMTFSIWFNAESLGSYDVLGTRTNGAWNEGWGMYYHGSKMNFWAEDYQGGQRAEIPYTFTNEWHHIVGTYDASLTEYNTKIYLDGVATAEADMADFTGSITDTGHDLKFGYTSGGGNIDGIVDEIALYSNALSASEVASLYAISHDRIEASMVGYWHMDEGTGATTADDADENDGTLMNGPTWDTGYFGESVVFDGSNDFVTVGEPDSMDFIGTENGFTLSAWVKIAQGEQGTIISKSIDTNADRQWQLFVGGSAPCGTIGANIGGQEKQWNSPATMPCMTNDEWHHVLLKNYNDGGTFYFNIWVDGVMSSDGPWASGSSDNNGQDADVLIGARENNAGGTGFYFTGSIDEVQVWSRALSADEIDFLYNFQYHGTPTGMDSAQEGRFLVSRTSSGEGGGGLAFFDTLYGAISTPNWTADVGGGNLVDMSDNANPMIIVGNVDNTIQVFNSAGVEKFSYALSDGITSVSIEDDNSYAYASSLNHHTYGWDLSRIADWDTYTSTLEGFTFEHAPTGYWKLDETSGTTAADDSGNGNDGTTYGAHDAVGYWKFDENIGLTAFDSTTNGNDATLIDGPTWATGKYDSGLDFDGIDDYVTISDDSSLKFGDDSFSVSFWMKSSQTTATNAYIIHKAEDDAGAGDAWWGASIDSSNKLHFMVDDGATSSDVVSSVDVNDGSWHHIVAIYTKSTSTTVYVDGTPSTTSHSDAIDSDSNSVIEIGRPTGVGTGSPWGDYYEGNLDEVAIWDGALNADEISEVYNSRKVNFTTDWTTSGKYDGAMEFDGIDDWIEISDDDALVIGGPITLSAWIYPTEADKSYQGIMQKKNSYRIYMNTGPTHGEITVQLEGPGNLFTGPIIPLNQWSLFTYTYDGADASAYLNGALVATAAITGPIDDYGENLDIGKFDGPDTYFTGTIDEVIVYETALSSTQVAQIYSSQVSEFTDTGLLEGFWPFEEGAGLLSADYSANDNDGELVGGATFLDDGKYGFGIDACSVGGCDLSDINGEFHTDDIIETGTSFTTSLWINLKTLGNTRTVIDGGAWDVRIYTDGRLNLRASTTEGTDEAEGYACSGAGCFSADYDEWHHIAATWTVGSSIDLFYDGVSISPTIQNDDGGLVSSQNIHEVGNGWLDADIDEVVYYNRALSATDIATLYSASHSGHPSTPAWDFWAGGEVTSLDSEDGKVAVGTSSGELIVLNSAGVEQWRRTLGGPVDFVTFHNGRVVADTDDTTSTINMFNDAHASFYFKYAQPAMLYLNDENDGLVVSDSSGNGLDADLPPPYPSTLSDPKWVGGQIGNAIDFTSTESSPHVGVTLGEPFPINVGADATVSTWFNVDEWSAYRLGAGLFDNCCASNYDSFIHIYRSDSGFDMTEDDEKVYIEDDTGAGYALQVSDISVEGTKLQEDTWYHLTLVFTGSAISLYLNGVLIDTESPLANSLTLTEFGRGYGATPIIDGAMDEVAFWNTAFSSTEVADMYGGIAGHVSSVQDGLEGHWTLDFDADDVTGTYGASTLSGFGTEGYWTFFENSGTLVQDLSGTGKDGSTGGEFGASGFWTMDGGSMPTPVSYWMMDENTGVTAYDSIGSNDGAITGATWTNGKYAYGLHFDGVDDYVLSPSGMNTADTMTMAGWFNTDSTACTCDIMALNSATFGSGAANGIQILIESTVVKVNAAGGGNIVNSGVTPTLNTWYHVAFTHDGTTNRIYINGVEEDSSTTALQYGAAPSFWISTYNGQNEPWGGELDDVGLWNTALSAREISALYDSRTGSFAYDYSGNANHGTTNSFSPIGHWKLDGTNMPAPIGYWALDETSGTTAYDSAPLQGSMDETLTAGPVWDTDGKYGGSLEFDGVDDYVGDFATTVQDGMTWSAWVKKDDASEDDMCVFSRRYKEDGLCLWGTGPEVLAFGLRLDGVNQRVYLSDYPQDTAWHHVTATYDTKMLRLYVDGIEKGNLAASGTAEHDGVFGFRIGEDAYSGANWDGNIDEVIVWDTALFSDEILSLYENGLPNFVYDTVNANHGDVTGQVLPVGHWKFNENTGTVVNDYGTGGNDGTINQIEPVGYWKMDETAGTNVPDLGSGGNDGATQNMGDSDWKEGYYGNALDFNGVDEYIDFGDVVKLTSDGITISAWFKTNSLATSEDTIVGKWNNGATGRSYLCQLFGDEIMFALSPDGTSAAQVVLTTAVDQIGNTNWHHVACVADGTNMNIYIDGVLYAQTAYTDPIFDTTSSLKIGDYTGSHYFDGRIDEVLIYDEGLTPDDIRHLYNAQKGVHSDNGLIAHWDLDEGTGTTAYDSTLGGHDGVLTSGPTWETGVSGISGVGFDGINDHIIVDEMESFWEDDSFSVSLWYQADIKAEHRICCAKGSSWDDYFLIRSYATGQISAEYNSNTDVASATTGASVLEVGQWIYITVTVEEGSADGLKLYIDGVLEDTDSTIGITNADADISGDIRIGDMDGSYSVAGTLDDISFWDRALTQKDVNELYGFRLENHPDLKAYWKFDEGTGTTVTDSSGGHNAVEESGNPTWGVGHLGGALEFDGVDDVYETISAPISADPFTAYTVSGWYASDYGSEAFRIAVKSSGAGHSFYLNNWNAGGGWDDKWHWSFDDGVSQRHIVSTSDATNGEFDHVVMVADGLTQKLYINGVLETTASYAGFDSTTFSTLSFGGQSGGSNEFEGRIDEVAVFSTPLSASEIAQLYNSQKDEHAPLIGYWAFEDGSGTTPVDSSGNNYHGEFSSSPTWVDGMSGGGLEFDGIDDYVAISSAVSSYGSGAFSTSAWIKMNEATQFVVVCKESQYYFRTFSDDNLYFGLYDESTSGEQYVQTTGTVTSYEGDWTHVVATYDGRGGGNANEGMKIYINGELPIQIVGTSGSFDHMEPSGDVLLIGADILGGTPRYSDGSIDEVALWDKALTAGEVSDLYDQRRTTFGPEWVDGRYGSALEYEALDDAHHQTVSISGWTALSASAWTTSFWIKMNDADMGVFNRQNIMDGTASDILFWNSYQLRIDEGASHYVDATPLLDFNWHQVSVVCPGAGLEPIVYIDTIVTDILSAATCDGDLDIDQFGHGSANPAHYTLDEFLAYDVALSDSEIAELYNSKSEEYAPPIAQWLFDENTGTDAYDTGYVGGGPTDNDGTISGASWVDGYDGGGGGDGGGWALDFDGTNDYVEITSLSGSTPMADSMSLSYWFKPENMVSWDTHISQFESGPVKNLYITTYDDELVLCMYGAFACDWYTGITFSTGTWYHIAIVYTGDSVDVYKNGEMEASKVTTGTPGFVSSTTPVYLGKNTEWGEYFDGVMDEVALYDRSLSAAEIKSMYHDRELGPVGYWGFSEGEGINTYGTGGYDGDFTNGGADGWTTWVDGVVGTGIHFDGTALPYTEDADVRIQDEPYNGGGAPGRIDNGYIEGWTELSFSGWVKPDFWGSTESTSATNNIIAKDGSGGANPFKIAHSNGELRVYMNGNTVNAISATYLPSGEWSHVGHTWDGSISRLYINGVLLDEDPFAEELELTDSALTFGDSARYSALGNFIGSIDEFYIYERGISYEEVTELYRAGERGKTEFSADFDRAIYGNGVTLDIEKTPDTKISFGDISAAETIPFSASVWLTYEGYTDSEHFMNKDGEWGCYIDSSTRVRCDVGGIGLYVTESGGSRVADGKWHHVVWTVASITSTTYRGTIYIDGVNVATTASSCAVPPCPFPSGSGSVNLGYSDLYGGPHWTGGLDDFMLFDKSLKDGEVLDLYNAQQGVYSMWGGPLHLLSFNDVTNGGIGATTWENDGSAGWDAYTTGSTSEHDPQWTEYGVSGGAVQFDADLDYITVCAAVDANCEPSGDAGTIATWFRTETGAFPTSGTPPMVNYYSDASNGVQLKFYANFGQQKIQLFIEDPDHPGGGQAFVDCLVDGEAADLWNIGWNHIVGSWDAGEEMRLYLNGVECGHVEGEHDITPPSLAYGDLYVAYEGGYGAWGIGGAEPVTMDEIGIYDVAISPDDVSRLYDTHRTEFGPDWVEDGYHHSALEFGEMHYLGGRNDYVTIDPDFTIEDDLTVAMWIKPASGEGVIIHQGESDTDPNLGAKYLGDEYGWAIRLGDDNHMYNSHTNAVLFMSSDSSGNYNENAVVATVPEAIDLDQWNHIAVTKKGTSVEIYINGILSVLTDNTGATIAAGTVAVADIEGSGGGALGNIFVGRSTIVTSTEWGNDYQGELDDLFISNQWMNGDRITDLYNAQMGVVEPVAYWSMDGNGGTGTHVQDGVEAPIGFWGLEENTGLATSNTAQCCEAGADLISGTAWDTGYRGYGLDFDGSNDYLKLPSTSYLNDAFDTEGTFSFWIKPETDYNDGANHGMFFRDSSGNDNLYKDWGNDQLTWNLGDNGAALQIQGDKIIWEQDKWYNIVLVWSGVGTSNTVGQIYLDGLLYAEDSGTTSNGDDGAIYMGYSYGYHNGDMDEITLWDRPLGKEEIEYLYGAANHGLMANGQDTTWVDGVVGGAMHFDGVDDYVAVPTSEALDDIERAITVSAWINADAWDPVGAWSPIVSTTAGGSWTDGFTLAGASTGGQLQFTINHYSDNKASIQIDASTGKWHHVVGTYDASLGSCNINIYLDGGQIGTNGVAAVCDDYTGDIGDSGGVYPLMMGQFNTGQSGQWQGSIDEVAIYDVALTPTQINDLYLGMRLNYHADRVDGKYGNAMEFHGDDYVEITDAGLEYGNEDVTVSAWVTIQDNDVDNYYPIMFLGDGDDSNPHILIAKSRGGYSQGRLYLELNDGLTSMTRAQSDIEGTEMMGMGWIHVVGVVDDTNSEIRLYINGELHDTELYPVGWSWDLSSSTDFKGYIGWNTEAAYFQGDIDSAIVFNAALSDSDVLDLYNDQRTTFTVDQTPGHLSGGYEFDGNDMITLDTPIADQDDLSMFIWVKPYDESPSEQALVAFDGNKNGIATGSGSDTLRIKHESVHTTNGYTDTTYIWTQNAWHHVGFTWDGATINIYANGELVNTAPLVDDTGNGFVLSSGLLGSFPSLDWALNGELDDFAIYDRALTDGEVQSIFMKSQARLQSGLIAYYPFHDNTFDDYSGNGIDPTTITAVLDSDGKIGDSADATGGSNEITIDKDDFPDSIFAGGGTVSAYVKSGSSGNQFIVDAMCWPDGWFLILDGYSGGKANLRFEGIGPSAGPTGGNGYFADYGVTIDAWQHVAMTYNSDTPEIAPLFYANGAPLGISLTYSTATGPIDTGNCDVSIGSNNNGADPVAGGVDDVAFWDRTLEPEEIYELSLIRSYDDEDSGLSIFTSDGELISEPGATTYNDAVLDDDGTVLLFDDSNNIEAWQTTNTRAAGFSDSENKISIPADGTINEPFTGGGTLSVWINPDSSNIADGGRIVDKDTWKFRAASVDIPGGVMAIQFVDERSPADSMWTTVASVPLGTWSHVAIVYDDTADSNDPIFYLNGVVLSSSNDYYGAGASAGDSTKALNIGNRESGSAPFNGLIADVRIYDDTLTLGELAILGAKNPMLTGNYWSLGSPVGWWKLDEDYTSGATTVIDYGSGGNDGTANDIETTYNGMTPRYAVFDGQTTVSGGYIVTQIDMSDLQEFTISSWVYHDNPSGKGMLFKNHNWDIAGFHIGFDPDFKVIAGTDIDGSSTPTSENYQCVGSNFIHEEWNFVSVSISTYSIKIYIKNSGGELTTVCDIVASASSGPSYTPAPYSNLNIGSTSGWSAEYFDGNLADVRVYDTTVTTADLAEMAANNPVITGTYAETEAQPLGWWKLNGNADDSSANGNDGTEYSNLFYQGSASNSAIFSSGTAITDASIDDGMIIAAEFQKVDIYDSMGNGWHANDGNPSWSLGYTDDIGAVHHNGITTAWGTGGKTYFKAPGIHPVNGNLIVLWDLSNSTPIAAITPPYSANNATFWAGEVLLDNDGNVYIQSRMDFNGDLDFVLYKFNSTGSEVWNITTHENQWLRRAAFMEDSRSSMDIAPNGTTIAMATDEYVVLIDTITGNLQAKTGVYGKVLQVQYASATQLVIATSTVSGATPEFYSLNATSLAEIWNFNAEVDAFQISCSKNSLYCVFTNGDQMAFSSSSNNTLFQKGIPDAKASVVANNGMVGFASSTKGWYIFDQGGGTLASGGAGQRVYDIDMDYTGQWMAVTGYDPAKGTAWMEIWALTTTFHYDEFTLVYKVEKASEGDGDARAYRVMFAEASTHVIWAWSSTDGSAGAEKHTIGDDFQFSVFADEARSWFMYWAIMLFLVIVLIRVIKRQFEKAGEVSA